MPQLALAKTGIFRFCNDAEITLPVEKNNVPKIQNNKPVNPAFPAVISGQNTAATPDRPMIDAASCIHGGRFHSFIAISKILINDALAKATASKPEATNNEP